MADQPTTDVKPPKCPRCGGTLYRADYELRCIKGHIAYVWDALERKWLVPHAPDGRSNPRI